MDGRAGEIWPHWTSHEQKSSLSLSDRSSKIWARCNWLDQYLGLAAKVVLFMCFMQQYPQNLVLGAIFSFERPQILCWIAFFWKRLYFSSLGVLLEQFVVQVFLFVLFKTLPLWFQRSRIRSGGERRRIRKKRDMVQPVYIYMFSKLQK
jgi:hypothetical protein